MSNRGTCDAKKKSLELPTAMDFIGLRLTYLRPRLLSLLRSFLEQIEWCLRPLGSAN